MTSAPTSSTAVGIPDAVTWPEVPGFIEGARGRIAEPFARDCKVNFGSVRSSVATGAKGTGIIDRVAALSAVGNENIDKSPRGFGAK